MSRRIAELGDLRFLYVGVADTEAALEVWQRTLGATLRWRFQAFAADVAAVEIGTGPLVLLADHRPVGSVLPIYEVVSLTAAREALAATGATVVGPLGTPEGDAIVVEMGDGVEIAMIEVIRPDAMDEAFADEADEHRVR